MGTPARADSAAAGDPAVAAGDSAVAAADSGGAGDGRSVAAGDSAAAAADPAPAAARPSPAGAGIDSAAAIAGVDEPLAARPDSVGPAAVTRRIPLLPWPFYGRRSLARLGPAGLAGLPVGSPEHRLLELLDFSECSGRPRRSVETCYFLEGGRVYALRREPGTAGRFRLTPLTLGRGASSSARAHVATSAPEGPVLVVPPGVDLGHLENAP